MSGSIQFGDEIEKYRVAQSIVDRHSFSFRPTALRSVTGIGGKSYSVYELGQSVPQALLYGFGKTVNTLFPLPDVNLIAMLFVGLLNPLLTALTCVVLFKTCSSLGFRYRTSLVLTIVYGLGTIAWPYARGFTREPLLGLLILFTFYATYIFSKTNDTRWLVSAGMAVGYLVFTKFIQAMVVPFFVLYFMTAILQAQKQSSADTRNTVLAVMKGLVLFSLPAMIFLGLQILYAMARFGVFYIGLAGSGDSPISQILNQISNSEPSRMIALILVSPEKSMFLYSPPALLVLVACFKWFSQKTRETVLILGLIAITFSSVIWRPYDGYGGAWWGSRYFVQITPLLILPIGALLESASQNARRFWNVSLGVLFAVGLFVQTVGTFSNDRDYLDIMGGIGTHLMGQIDFLRHGALDSLVLSLSPTGFPLQINPFGVVLLAVIVVLGAWIVAQLRSSDVTLPASPRHSVALLVLVLAIEFVALITWIVAPYPQVIAAKGNTRFVAANNFLADGRTCEARALYLMALDRGTTYQRETVAQLNTLLPHAPGIAISANDLIKHVEMPDNASVEVDESVTVSGEGSFKASVPGEKDAIVIATSDPIPALPNTAYELSGWMKTENIYGAGYGVVTLYEDDGNWGSGRTTDLTSLDETHGWQPFGTRITTLATTKRVIIKASLWKTFGTVWVDGLVLGPAIPPLPAGATPPCQ